MYRLGVITLSALFIIGCDGGEVGSEDVATESIDATITVTADGGGFTDVSVKLYNGSYCGYYNCPSRIVLTEGDYLLASISESNAVMAEDRNYDRSTYISTFLGEHFADPIIVTLVRPDLDDASAEVILPPPFIVDLPEEDAHFQPREQIDIVWQPALPGKTITLNIESECRSEPDELDTARDLNGSVELEIDDSGLYSINAHDLTKSIWLGGLSIDTNSRCTAELLLRRENMGEIVENFLPSSTVRAQQFRRVDFTFAPYVGEESTEDD